MCVYSNCFRYTVAGVAVAVALLAVLLPQSQIEPILSVVFRFFECMTLCLVVGALIKYLFSGPSDTQAR